LVNVSEENAWHRDQQKSLSALPRTRYLAEINGKRWRQGLSSSRTADPVRLDAACTMWMLSFTSINPKAVFTDTFLVSKCIGTIWGIWIILGRFPRSYMIIGSLPCCRTLELG